MSLKLSRGLGWRYRAQGHHHTEGWNEEPRRSPREGVSEEREVGPGITPTFLSPVTSRGRAVGRKETQEDGVSRSSPLCSQDPKQPLAYSTPSQSMCWMRKGRKDVAGGYPCQTLLKDATRVAKEEPAGISCKGNSHGVGPESTAPAAGWGEAGRSRCMEIHMTLTCTQTQS